MNIYLNSWKSSEICNYEDGSEKFYDYLQRCLNGISET